MYGFILNINLYHDNKLKNSLIYCYNINRNLFTFVALLGEQYSPSNLTSLIPIKKTAFILTQIIKTYIIFSYLEYKLLIGDGTKQHQ